MTESQINKLGTILGIWAHPDDETWATAGIMSAAVANNQSVTCVTATLGDAGQTADEQRWPQKDLSNIRKKELDEALRRVGVTDLRLLGYDDGRLTEVDENGATEQLLEIIKEVKPRTIFTFEPGGMTGHPDHQTVSRWACLAVKKSGSKIAIYGAVECKEVYDGVGRECDDKFNIYFATKNPFLVPRAELDLCFCLSGRVQGSKQKAFRAHKSQTANLLKDESGRRLCNEACEHECFIRLSPDLVSLPK